MNISLTSLESGKTNIFIFYFPTKCLQQNTKLVSYRRNRDYTKHFEWTYELNRDVDRCYTQAKSDPRIGHMKRLKKNWDELHPNSTHFNEKQLRQQATFVEFKYLILETNLKDTHREKAP